MGGLGLGVDLGGGPVGGYDISINLGPDKVAPVNTVVGLDGSKCRVTRSVDGTVIDYGVSFLWQMIQVPEGEPHLLTHAPDGGGVDTPFNGIMLAPDFVLYTGGAMDLFSTFGGSDTAILSTWMPLPLSLVGSLLVIDTGPCAGTYHIDQVLTIDGWPTTYIITIKEVFPASTSGSGTGVSIYDGTTSTAVFPVSLPATVLSGDVLLINGNAVTITSVFGDTVKFTPAIPVNTAGSPASIILQTILWNARTSRPAFIPTVQGLYLVRAFVSSSGSPLMLGTGITKGPGPGPIPVVPAGVVVVNATAASTAMGLPLDASWIWRYLSDFWGHVSDKKWVEAEWRSVIRAAGALLQETWNVELAASLGTAEDVQMSRWLGYDAELKEPDPAKALLVRRSRVLCSDLWNIGKPDVTITLKVYRSATPDTFTLTGPAENLPAQFNALMVGAGIQGVVVRFELMDPIRSPTKDMALTIRSDRYVVEAEGDLFHGSSPFKFSTNFIGLGSWRSKDTFVLQPASFPILYSDTVYDADAVLRPGDPINIDGVCRQVVSVGTLDLDTFGNPIAPRSFVIVDPPLQVAPTMPSDSTWCIPSYFQSPETDFYDELVTPGDPLIMLTGPVMDRHEDSAIVYSVWGYKVGVLDYKLWYDGADYLLSRILRFWYVPVQDEVLSIPQLKVQPDEERGWLEFVNYIITDFRGRRAIVFDFANALPIVVPPSSLYQLIHEVPTGFGTPPDRYWAEIVYMDQRPTLSKRFGDNLGLLLENAPTVSGFSYARALLGLWYCYLHGPKPANLEKGVSIIMGAPFFESDGTIVDSQILDATRGYLLVQDKDFPEVVRSYIYPLSLGLGINPSTGVAYTKGDTVVQFNPVSDAAVFRDYINDPAFIRGLIAAGIITEPEKTHTFSLGVDSYFFHGISLKSLEAATEFLHNFRTTYNRELFALILALYTDIKITDEVALKATMFLDMYLGSRWGTPIWDRVQLSGSGVHSRFDFILTGKEHWLIEMFAGPSGRIWHLPDGWTDADPLPTVGVMDPQAYGIKGREDKANGFLGPWDATILGGNPVITIAAGSPGPDLSLIQVNHDTFEIFEAPNIGRYVIVDVAPNPMPGGGGTITVETAPANPQVTSQWVAYAAGDKLIYWDAAIGAYNERLITAVYGDPSGNPAHNYFDVGAAMVPSPWTGNTKDFGIARDTDSPHPGTNWMGFDDIRYYPRTKLDIVRSILGSAGPTNATMVGANPVITIAAGPDLNLVDIVPFRDIFRVNSGPNAGDYQIVAVAPAAMPPGGGTITVAIAPANDDVTTDWIITATYGIVDYPGPGQLG
ncbi:MAG: hypothetical protein GYA36_19570 [Veillonellaceae bacterium]|nr:hypothetical protein [Veillonellaceae bacterium]